MASFERRGESIRAIVTVNGKRQSRTFSSKKYGDVKRAQKLAERWAEEREAVVANNPNHAAVTGRTIGQMIGHYCKVKGGFELDPGESPMEGYKRFIKTGENAVPCKHPIKAARSQIGTYLNYWWYDIGHVRVADFTVEFFANRMATLEVKKPGIQNSSLDAYGRMLSAAFGLVSRSTPDQTHGWAAAAEGRWLDTNPLKGCSFRTGERRERTLSRDEEQALFKALADDPELTLIVRIALLTGLRRGSIMNLQWSKIDLKTGQYSVMVKSQNTGPHGGKIYHGRFAEPILDGLKKWRARDGRMVGNDWVFSCTFPGMADRKGEFPKKRFNVMLERAGIARVGDKTAKFGSAKYWGFQFKDLRKTASNRLYERGYSADQIKVFMGHESPDMTEYYLLQNERLIGEMNDALS